MNRTNWLQKVLLLALIWMLLLSTSCAPQPEVVETEVEELPTERPKEVPEPTSTIPAPRVGNKTPIADAHLLYDDVCPEIEDSITRSINEVNGYIQEEIFIIGNPTAIDRVVVEFIDYFEPEDPIAKIPLSTTFGTLENFEIHLYQIDLSETSVERAVEDINLFIIGDPEDPADDLQYVLAEPNYVTSLPGGPETSADPCRGCSGGISGNSTTPGAVVPASPDLIGYAQAEFLNQWAFGGQVQHEGSIGLYDLNNQWVANHTGEKVDIVVFDTVPIGLDNGYNYIDWASIPFDLCVMRPGVIISAEENPQVITDTTKIGMQEHGLFVTGLAQGVAPAAHYFLIEALNEDGKGDVGSLINGMNEYAKERSPADENYLKNTVINLSLGLDLDKITENQAELDSDLKDLINLIKELLETVGWDFLDPLYEKIVPSVALQLAMKAYEQNGAVIVAAAGNDNGKPSQSPAGFPDVLGVASNDIGADWSCFSNAGDLAAPGGNGEGSSCNLDMVASCKGIPYIGNCPHVVISILSDNPSLASDETDRYGFGYWAGTSMSTPLVSGLAALFLEKCPNSEPVDVRGILTTSAVNWNQISELGAGVIYVGETMGEACPVIP